MSLIKVTPSLNDITAYFSQVIDAHVEATAKSKGYNSAVALVSYKLDPNPAWAAEAEAFIAWRSQVWASAYGLMPAMQSVPTEEEVLAALPKIAWPEASSEG